MDKIIQETLSSIETDGDIIRGISTRRRNPPDMSRATFYTSLIRQSYLEYLLRHSPIQSQTWRNDIRMD